MEPDPLVVEQIVARLTHSLRTGPDFTPCDGISAALTFSLRFVLAIVNQSLTPQDRKANVHSVVQSLHRMAAQVEFEQPSRPTVH